MRRTRNELSGKVAAVTGAASGIGRALAVELCALGASVALSDVDEIGLAETATQCASFDTSVMNERVDVSNRSEVFDWAQHVVDSHGRVNLIFNNAGVGLSGTAEHQSIDDFGWLMDINFWGVVHGTQAFLPYLRESGSGHVVNISSVFGLMSIPTQSAYNAAKFAVRGYSDALRVELEMAGAPVSVTTVHPGGVKTGIARNARIGSIDPLQALSGQSDQEAGLAVRIGDLETSTGNVDKNTAVADRFDTFARTSPEKAAKQIVRAVQRNRRRALIGPDAVLFDVVSRMPVSIAQRLTMAVARRQVGNTPPRT
jgi:short-subunit dehydrogenase